MTTNLYDLLDVPETASEQEIRAAWKKAIADLDPTERRFGVFNKAASVLLDLDQRAAHDAELDAERTAAGETEILAVEDAQVESADQTRAADEPAEDGSSSKPATGESSTSTKPRATTTGTNRQGPPGWAFGAAGVGALVALVLAIYLLAQPGGHLFGDDSPREVAEQNHDAERATLAAEGAAERMVAPVLSYNFETMAADLDRLKGYLTPAMVKKQTAAWPDLTTEATKQQIVVEAKTTGTALTRLSADNKRATVVVFIDQSVKKAEGEPFVLHMWATMELVRDGQGDGATWLLDDLCTDASCG